MSAIYKIMVMKENPLVHAVCNSIEGASVAR